MLKMAEPQARARRSSGTRRPPELGTSRRACDAPGHGRKQGAKLTPLGRFMSIVCLTCMMCIYIYISIYWNYVRRNDSVVRPWD